MNLENCFNEMLEYSEAIKSSFVKGHVSDWPEKEEVTETPEAPEAETPAEPEVETEEPVNESDIVVESETPEVEEEAAEL